jgi:hypothetical protein
LPAPDVQVVAKKTPDSRRELLRILSVGELLQNLPSEKIDDPGVNPDETAVVDGQVFLTDQPKGTRFSQVTHWKIDDLVFESGSKYADEFAHPDEFGEPTVATKEELAANSSAGWYARLCKIIQHIGYDRDRQQRMLRILTTPEQRQRLKESFVQDRALMASYRGRVADHIQRLVISVIEDMDKV